MTHTCLGPGVEKEFGCPCIRQRQESDGVMSSEADKDPDEDFTEAGLGLDPMLKLINCAVVLQQAGHLVVKGFRGNGPEVG